MRGPAAKYATLAGVVSLVGVMGLLPMWLRNKMGSPISASEKCLTGSQIQRGQFMNSGSKDAGPDPDWDMRKGVYKPHARLYDPGAYPEEPRKGT